MEYSAVAERGTYRRIADQLRQRILSGALQPGEMLPSEAALAEEHRVARGTVRSALTILAGEGLIEVVPGQGRQVTGKPQGGQPPRAAYERIALDLRKRLEEGEFEPNQPLPSESDLMAQYRVSRNTVRRAYRHLAEAGVVLIRHGAGAFPAPLSDSAGTR